jgi:hypothetical protein
MSWKRPVLGLTSLVVLFGFVLTARSTPAQERPKKEEYPRFEDVTDGFEAESGLFTIYRKKHQLLLEVPEHELGRVFLVAMSVAGGSTLAGHQSGSFAAAFERVDRKVLLVEKEVHWRGDEKKPLGEVVKRTYADHVRRTVNVLTQHGPNAVIDLIELFGHGAPQFFGGVGSNLDSSVCRVAKLKSFPQNLELALTMPTRSDGELTTLFYSLSQLPDPRMDDYQPRKADDRIGYFLTAHKDFSNDHDSTDRFVRFVNRWDLRKADPTLPVSPPRKPIVFYIEKTVPYRYRKAVAEGILEWNKAFEKCGFSNAMVVRQQTEDNEFKDFDPEDVRYNFFRWITSETSFAMGPSRVNPYTGQILDADIIFDDSMARFYLRDYEWKVKSAPGKLFSGRLQKLLAQHPERYPFYDAPTGEVETTDEANGDSTALDAPGSLCSLGEGLAHQIAFASLAGFDPSVAAGAQPAGKKEFPQEFIEQVLKEIVMHEVGHTLGLRHNFKGSSWRPLSEVNSKEAPDATSGSVMDYNPLNVRPSRDVPQGKYVPQTLGPYDYWAIDYGYRDGASEPDLKQLASRVEESGFAYATDEDTAGPDPLVNRWDFGADPLEFAENRMKVASGLFTQIEDRVVDKGDGWQDARRAFDMILYDYAQAGMFASRFVGGEYCHRDHKGDPNEKDPNVPVEAQKQRQALKLVCERVFTDAAFRFSPELVRRLANGHWSHWGSNDWMQEPSYRLYDKILASQEWSLFQLTNPETLERLVTADAKVGEKDDVFTVAELFQTLDAQLFAELDSNDQTPATPRKPFISTVRRNLQSAYARTLIDIALEQNGPSPQEARTLVRHRLKGLKDKIATTVTARGAKLDPYSAAHLDEVKTRIEKTLDAIYTAR